MGRVPTISINKTEGCQVYLSKDSLDCDIVSAKSSEMNILIPHGEDEYVSVEGENIVFPLCLCPFNVFLNLPLFHRGSFQYQNNSRLSGMASNW